MEVFIKEVLVWTLYGLSMTSSKEEYLAKVTERTQMLPRGGGE
jgi:hypothetical protein